MDLTPDVPRTPDTSSRRKSFCDGLVCDMEADPSFDRCTPEKVSRLPPAWPREGEEGVVGGEACHMAAPPAAPTLPPLTSEAMACFLGPAQAVAIAPFCPARDVATWAAAHRALHASLSADFVWRQLLGAHFRPALECLSCISSGSALAEEAPEAIVAQLPRASPREVYAALQKTSSEPFMLEPRARLMLEIHELREWDKHQRQLIIHRQACHVAGALGRDKAVEQLRAAMAPGTLELVSLQEMMGGGGAARLLELSGLQWGPAVDSKLRQLMEKRLQRRRTWWQRQREYLLQDLGWH